MKKELTNKGFSLVELIIVIAIMAVMVGYLAPQYLKYVNNSKVSHDIYNAEELATAMNVAFADGLITTGVYSSKPVGIDCEWPSLKATNGRYVVTVRNTGVAQITDGNAKTLYPEPKGIGGYYSAYHK